MRHPVYVRKRADLEQRIYVADNVLKRRCVS